MSRKNNSFLKVKDSSSSRLSKWYGYRRMKIALRGKLSFWIEFFFSHL
ncbi:MULTISPECIES: hypothetical protein [Peribacillus]|nr:hypothetical protein [Peribacillus simplex]MDF9762734.1 hypothetical protein [Peribacillus simplex]